MELHGRAAARGSAATEAEGSAGALRAAGPGPEATGGAISVLLGSHKPGEGPPDHVHFSQEEIFFVVEGTYELTVGDQTSTAGPGTIVFIPRNVVHRFKNVGDTTARMLDWSLPGGQDHYFKAIADLATGDGFTGEKVMEISRKFDTNFPAAR